MATVSFDDLTEAHLVAAQIVARDGAAFLPIFARIEAEIKAAGERNACVARAVEISRLGVSREH